MNSKINIETNKISLNNINKEENKFKIVYSPYGYVKILEDDINNNTLTLYKFVQYKNINNDNNFMLGTIFKNNIKQNINIKVKYFSGKRKIVLFENIDINSKLNILIENLFLDEKNNREENFSYKKYTA